jgi:hyperosmotically inducible protein
MKKANRNYAKPLIASAMGAAFLVAPISGFAEVGQKASATSASETGEQQYQQYQDAMFKRLDADHDGFISRAESQHQPRFLDAFDQADEDRDGRISDAEYIKARSIYERQRAASYAKDSLITAKVKAALVKDPDVSALDVSVETAYGEVLLSGFVENERQVKRAREVASGIDGVKDVHANLVVKG